MFVGKKVSEIKEALRILTRDTGSVGFVPTMGALHPGHAALITRAKSENQVVVCSIFVNPTQFNDKNDLLHYPRTPESDISLLTESGCDALFLPSVEEMYPDDHLLEMDFGPLERVMEGGFRPGHFKGVATVVSRFFEIFKPHRAYFGEKDFQQLAVIKEMNKRQHSKIAVVGCETMREPDGLAMSSRNIHLLPEERTHAGIIYETLIWAAVTLRREPVEVVRQLAISKITAVAAFKVQYLEFVDSETLESISNYDLGRPQRICIAVLTARTRLIDNVAL